MTHSVAPNGVRGQSWNLAQEQTGMRVNAEPVSEWTCIECDEEFNPQAHQPLTIHKCEQCGKKQMVPGMFAQFRLVELLAKGASGYVFKSQDEQLRRDVAIKILRADDEEGQKRANHCVEKARVLAALSHHNIVHIFNINEHDGRDYIVMELVKGGKALHLIDHADPPTEKRVLEFALGVAEGLRAAYKVNLVHMNVKPNNILLTADGSPKLLDFGSAQFGKSKGIVGTPYYIAPEVAQHQPPDSKSDMYSFGATLYHIFTGQPPFTGKTAKEVINKRLKFLAAPLSKSRDDISDATEQLVATLLQPHPDNRYSSYDALVEAIHATISGDMYDDEGDDAEPSSALDMLAEASVDTDLSASTGRRRRPRITPPPPKPEPAPEPDDFIDEPDSVLDELASALSDTGNIPSSDEPIDLEPPKNPAKSSAGKKRPKSPTDSTLVETGSFPKNRKSSRPKNPEGSESETLGKTDLSGQKKAENDALSEPDF
jgi:serine/threonine protein kinase